MTDRMKNGECCPYNGYKGLHSPWCNAGKKEPKNSDARILSRLRDDTLAARFSDVAAYRAAVMGVETL